MRKNKAERMEDLKCSYSKCPNKGVTGFYFRNGERWCSKSCFKKQIKLEQKNDK